jgi:membrane protease YdiL (CAAX protease family)
LKQALRVSGKFLAFLILWGGAVSIPLVLWERPPFAGDDPARLRLWWELAPCLMTLLVTLIFQKAVERKIGLRLPWWRHPLPASLNGLGLGLIWLVLPFGAALLLGIYRLQPAAPIPSLWVWVLAVFLNVIMQEWLVRGYLYGLLKRDYSSVTAIVVTSLLFTGLHAGAFETGLLAVINIFTTSLLLSLALEWSGGLWMPILMHFVWNALGSLAGVVLLADDYPALYQLSTSGAHWLNGGTARIEGSSLTLAVNLLLIGLLLVLNKKKPRSDSARAVW